MPAITALAILLSGYSIFSAMSIAFTHFRADNYQGKFVSKVMGLNLLLVLGGLQMAHFMWLYFDQLWITSIVYRAMLFSVAPTFFLFSQPLLRPQNTSEFQLLHLFHAFPILISPWLTTEIGLPMAFIVGAGYLLWLGRSLYELRGERARFRLEMILLGTVFAIAVGVSILGLALSVLPQKLFFSLYAVSIGLAFLLVQIALGLRPHLSTEITETVQAAYASSTLANVDCDVVLAKLASSMQTDKIYVDSNLNLAVLASHLNLSTHQLSELMNSRLGKGFSRYVREQRISAAKKMLVDEPSASVLSVGLSVGFTSQSNFYEAFREIEGMTPGQYRKLTSKAPAR